MPDGLTLLASTASCAYLVQGYGHAVLNGILTLDSFQKQFPQLATVHASKAIQDQHDLVQGTVVAVLQLGCALGALLCFFLGDFMGRKRTIMISAAACIIGITLQCSAFGLPQLVVGRALSGIGAGGFAATIPMWLSESLEADRRGGWILFCGSFGNVGMVASMCVDLVFYFVKSPSNWRVAVGLQLVPALALFVQTLFIQESPRWLIKQKRHEEAVIVLARIRGESSSDPALIEEVRLLDESLEMKDLQAESHANHRTGYRTYLAASLSLLCTMAGINVITFFSTSLLQNQLNFSPVLSRVISLCLQVCQMIFAFLSVLFIDRLGRRAIMMTSAGIMAVGMICMAGLSEKEATDSGLATAIVVFQFVCMCGYPIGFHTTPHLYGAEVSPLLHRHRITAFSTFIHWMIDVMIAEVTPFAFANIHWRYYLVFASANVFNLLSLYFLYPETKNKTLEDIDALFAGTSNPFKLVEAAKSSQLNTGNLRISYQSSVASSNVTKKNAVLVSEKPV